jgi:hypothetical protein
VGGMTRDIRILSDGLSLEVWSNLTPAETVLLLDLAKQKIVGNAPIPEPVGRGKVRLA